MASFLRLFFLLFILSSSFFSLVICDDDKLLIISSNGHNNNNSDDNFNTSATAVLMKMNDDEPAAAVCDDNENSKCRHPYRLRNWGKSFEYSTQNIEYPETVAEVQEVVKAARKLRVIGNRHSYSEIGNSDGTILSTQNLNNIISFNASVPSVIVQPGVAYTDLAPVLYAKGYALPNLAALAGITVAGATQTCVHGSGIGNKNLATHVRSIQLVLANGSLVNFGPDSPELKAVVCGLGAFGVVTQLELLLEPSFNVTNYQFLALSNEEFQTNFDAIEQLGYSVNPLTFHYGTGALEYVLIAARSGSEQDKVLAKMDKLYNATKSKAEYSLNNPIFLELNKAQPWYNGLPIWKIGQSGFGANEIESEYFVPMENAVAAIKALEKLVPAMKSLVTVHLIRTIAPDDLWMSQYQHSGPMVSLHFSWKNDKTALNPVLAQLEAVLEPFGVRPHWAKYFTMHPSKFLKYYPKLDEFKKLAKAMDPEGKFRNKFLDFNVFADI